MAAQLCVIQVSAVPPAVRGLLRRWLTEPVAGVFVGRPSHRIRQYLWQQVQAHLADGTAVMVVPDASELGAHIEMAGDHRRVLVDLDGLALPGLQIDN